ncbi:dihydrofolate reductase family protein [Microlunatus speluncae]|uniref:dihydrofolate reductase family protein n=1 Tax=Microlunatus speluncae TaxID=2594267 RepID=UPI00126665D4|nr:dihydrofolate reductase family protein [Microlunatus speluncae]
MRDVVMAMQTTINGRLDDPEAWVSGIDDDQYAEIDRRYDGFDSILIGTTTYAEMFEYWPGALEADTGFVDSNAKINRRMAEKMNAYRKYVFTRQPASGALAWNNSERVVAATDDDLVRFVTELKEQPGRDLHLAGGAALVQDFVRLGLIDRYRLLVYPVHSPGACWFDKVARLPDLRVDGVDHYPNDVIGIDYRVVRD